MASENLAFQPSHADICRASELRWRGAAPGIPPEMADEFMAAVKAGKDHPHAHVRQKGVSAHDGNTGPVSISFLTAPDSPSECPLHSIFWSSLGRANAIDMVARRTLISYPVQPITARMALIIGRAKFDWRSFLS
jgi:hypothetical protein